MKGEKILKVLKPSRWAYFWWFLVGILTAPLIVGIFIIIITELVRRANTYFITTKRLIHEFTFLSRKISSVIYDRIQDLHLTQSILERIVGIGTLHINTAGTHFVELKFKGISNPISIKRLIEQRMMRKGKSSV